MNLTESQRKDVHNIIEKAKVKECAAANAVIENAINEWKIGKKNDIDAYNKIYKKVIKNEHHLVHRYTNLDDKKMIITLAEIFADDIIEMLDFENLDSTIKKEVYKIVGVNAKP